MPEPLGARYELDGVIGRGGMTMVYRARDIRLGRIVAVKMPRADLGRDQTFLTRFRSGAQSAALLDYPSIVAVYYIGDDVVGSIPVPYIVMEYVDGYSLRDRLCDERPLLPKRALEVIDGVLSALNYSHSHGILHRHINSANVMLTRSGDVKVMGFGVAPVLSDDEGDTTDPLVIGSADCLSPEQARGDQVDARSDLYSTGCLLYELLTGRPPFIGDSPIAIAYQHVREDPVPPSRVDRKIPARADAIVLKAMAKNPGDRYQNAAEMRAEIQRAIAGNLLDSKEKLFAPQASQFRLANERAEVINNVQRDRLVGPSAPTAAAAGPGHRSASPAKGASAPWAKSAKRRRSQAAQSDDPVNMAVKAALKPGLLTFNPPAVMIQGQWERVEVGIARSTELRETLATGLRGRGEPQFESISTSPFMSVELSGPAFMVRSFSPTEQLVPQIGRWEFDVRPVRAGRQTLTLCVSLRVDSPITSGHIAVPVLERDIRIRVDVGFSIHRFLVENWQWLIATALGIGGALAAWVTLFR